MEPRGSAQAVNDEAAQWVARIDRQPLDEVAKADLASWLASDVRHRGALFRAFAIWQTIAQNQTIDTEVWGLLHQAEPFEAEPNVPEGVEIGEPEAPDRSIDRRRLLWGGSAAAASLIGVALLTGLVSDSMGSNYNRIETQLGEMRKVPLRDGSLVVVNTASRLEVSQSSDVRRVQLDEGEAWFKVAKDKSRPFVVSAGDVRVRAVGTAFSVRRREDGADVQVTDGVVEVWSEARADKRIMIPAGTRAFVSDQVGGQGLVKDPADIERELSWREGVLKFQGSTLREAADEFNRYNMIKLQIDPAIANEEIVGRFNSDEPDTFARVVSLTFNASVEKRDGRIHIEKN
jgi:transmembrane sensor